MLTILLGKEATTRGVQTGPGAIAFTRMPLSMRCADSPLVNVTIAPCTQPAHVIVGLHQFCLKWYVRI